MTLTTSSTLARILLVVLLVTAIYLVARVIWPFSSAFFLAAVLAGAFHPWHNRLAKKLKGRRMLAAGIIVAAVIIALVLPLGTMGAIAVKEALEAITYIRTTMQSEGVRGLIDRLPETLKNLAEQVISLLPKHERTNLGDLAGSQGGRVVGAVGGVLQATTEAVLQTTMMLIAFFFLLTDGGKLVNWASDNLPLRRVQLKELLEEFRRVSVAVLVSTLATAGVQAIVAFIGYLIARVPNAAFFTMVTFFVGLIPAVGAAAVSVVLAGLLFIGGQTWWALFLLLWGLIVVGLVDNVVKPLLIRGGLELHGAIVFFALLGGLAAFGGIGLLAGPLAVAFFLATVSMCRREFKDDPLLPEGGTILTP